MTLKGKYEFAGCTDKGMVRESNEDHFGYDAELGLAIVADGMGGYKAGEVASALASVAVTDWIRDNPDRAPDAGLLVEAIQRANLAVHLSASSKAHHEGMGTTIVACLFRDGAVTVANAGDSRLYRFRGGQIELLTSDHSLLGELVARGLYTPEEARKSQRKNLVTRALGMEETVEVDVVEAPVEPGDIYLLCSDGVSDMVDDQNIGLTISSFGANLQAAAEQLVQLANENGGHDNVTALLVRAG